MRMRACVVFGASLTLLSAGALAATEPATPEVSPAPTAVQPPASLTAHPVTAAPTTAHPAAVLPATTHPVAATPHPAPRAHAAVHVTRPAIVPIPIMKPTENIPIPIPSPLHSASLPSPAAQQSASVEASVHREPFLAPPSQPSVQPAQAQDQPEPGETKPVKVYWFLSGR